MDQNSEMRLEDAGSGSGVRFRKLRGDETWAPTDASESWAIIDEESGEILGGIGFRQWDAARRSAELAYRISHRVRHHDVATTALREFSRVALDALLDRLELLIPWDDPAGIRAALEAGYAREAIRRGDPELLVYSRLASDPDEPVTRLLPDLPGGELSDGVIALRALGVGDVAFYTELHNVPDVIATSVPPEPKAADEILRRCTRAEAHWLAGKRADLVIVDIASGAPAGQIDLYYQGPLLGEAMIGYSMLPAYRRRGFATRAAQLLALWVFAETNVVRLIAGALPTNVGSQRVLGSAGFTREAYQRERLPGPDGTRVDDVQFVLLAGDLLAQASGEPGSHA